MSRRHRAEKREILPDAKFGDVVISRFMNALMYDGKKSVAEGIVYVAFLQVSDTQVFMHGGHIRGECEGARKERDGAFGIAQLHHVERQVGQ